MHLIIKFPAAFLLFFLMLTQPVCSQTLNSLQYEVLLDSKLLLESKVTGNLQGCLDFTAGNLVVLSTADQMYLLGWGGLVKLGNKTKPAPESFAFTPDSILLVTRGNQLCYLDSLGNLTAMFTLPSRGMGIARGAHVMYLYTRFGSKCALYLLAPGGKYSKILEVPKPIAAVTEYLDDQWFCTENGVFRYNSVRKELKTVAVLADGSTITSLAIDPQNGRVYFSTNRKVYTVGEGSIRLITDQMGGNLMVRDGLILFDPAQKIMLRVKGITGDILSVEPPAPVAPAAVVPSAEVKPPADVKILNEVKSAASGPTDAYITNRDVIALVRNHLSDELIIRLIGQVKVHFSLGVDDLIELHTQQVSAAVIRAMRASMEAK
jgi:hypothetical protein